MNNIKHLNDLLDQALKDLDKAQEENETLKKVIKELHRLWNTNDSDEDIDYLLSKVYETITKEESDEEDN